MLKWRQIQAVADKLAGREALPLPPAVLAEPWRTMYHRVEPVADRALAEHELWKATEGLEDRVALIGAVLTSIPQPGAYRQFESLDAIASSLPPVEWLWPDWIPRGLLTLLGGASGTGKSLVALDLARRIIHGLPLPDGTPVEPISRPNVLYVDAEAVPQIQNQRALAWGLDRSYLYLMLSPEPYEPIDLACTEHQDRLIQMIYELQPHLLIVDSLSSINLRGENSIEDVRALLRFLGAVAREFDLALLLVHHLRKRGLPASAGAEPPAHRVTIDDFRGSSHIIAMARSVLALSIVQDGPETDRNGPRRLEVVKTNLCRYPPPLGIRFEAEDARAPTLRYTDAPEPYRPPTQVDACAEWLVEHLAQAGEPVKPQAAVQAAREAGFGRHTVYRARQKLGAALGETGSGPRDPRKCWTLAGAGE